MSKGILPKISNYFADLEDPRIDRKKLHNLRDIVTIAICAVICGADGWNDMEEYGNCKKAWLQTFLELPNGIPSHDTFNRVFSLLSPKEFQECFTKWIKDIYTATHGEIIAIDGKTLRRSGSSAGNKKPLHMISAWAKANGLVLGQVKTEEKSNEITAIPELIKSLELGGCIVTIDAMGCQKDIALKIVNKGADYVLALKGNQNSLHEDIKLFFEDARKTRFKGVKKDYYKTVNGDHGRIEIRKCWTIKDVGWINKRHQWERLKMIAMVENKRCIGEKTTKQVRYYISSMESGAKEFGEAIRGHWGIENSVHWILDIAFREDESRIRERKGAENFAILRRMALNLLKQETSIKKGIKVKRLRAGWDNDYFKKILQV